MFKKVIALLAVFAAVAQASMEAGGHPAGEKSPESDSKDYSPVANANANAHADTNAHPIAGQEQHPYPNSTYSIPSLTPSGTAPPTSKSKPPTSSSITSSKISSGFSSSASYGFPSYTNSSITPSATFGPSVTTKVITTTITSCPVTVTHGSGAEASTSVYYTTSTKTITSTITVCTKCVEAPKTSSPASSPETSQENSPEGGNESNPENSSPDETKTITVGSGKSTTVITTTIKNTKTLTNTHTVYASPSAGSSPEEATQCKEGEECVTQTSKIYKTSTLYITRPSTCPPQATVTVPGPDVTVTVTAMEGPPSGVPGGPSESASLPVSSAPYGNSTILGTGTSYASTGFITKAAPTSSDLFPIASALADANADS